MWLDPLVSSLVSVVDDVVGMIYRSPVEKNAQQVDEQLPNQAERFERRVVVDYQRIEWVGWLRILSIVTGCWTKERLAPFCYWKSS
jgi:hypothetical protein